MSIQAVFFDMGGTIETFGFTRELRLKATPGIRAILAKAGIILGISDAELLDVITKGLSRYHALSLETMIELPSEEVWQNFVLPGFQADPEKVGTIAEEAMVYLETHYYQRKMRPEIPAVLQKIQDMGLKIGLISNVNSRGQVPQNLADYGIRQYFNPVVLSSEYGRRKPDPAIFHYAARLASVPTSACVYVGDRIARDVLGARKAGFHSAVQIQHDFHHGEPDEGAIPDLVIDCMDELIFFLRSERSTGRISRDSDDGKENGVCALLFDAGDILYHRPGKGDKLTQFLVGLGLSGKISNPEARDALTQKAYRGEITQEQFREELIRLYGVCVQGDIETGKKILADEDESVEFFDGVPETLLVLKKAGFLLGIITDTANPISTKLHWFDQAGFAHVWDSIISSQELGIRKPDPGVYQAAMTQLGTTPGRTVFVGHKQSELSGADAVGITTIAFNYDPGAKADFFIEQFPDLLRVPIIGLAEGIR